MCEFYSLEKSRRRSECLRRTSTRIKLSGKKYLESFIAFLKFFIVYKQTGENISPEVENNLIAVFNIRNISMQGSYEWVYQQFKVQCAEVSEQLKNSLSESGKVGNEIIFRSVILIQVLTALLARRKFWKFFKNKRFLAFWR